MNRTEFERRAQLWRTHRTICGACVAIAGGLFAASIVIRSSPAAAIVTGIMVSAGIGIFLRKRARPVTAETIAAHLNRLCPPLEESAGLWLCESSTLSLVERLQLRRINTAWETLPEKSTLGCPRPEGVRRAFTLSSVAALTMASVVFWPRRISDEVTSERSTPIAPHSPAIDSAPALRTAILEIEPPPYLGETPRRVDGLDAEVPEGATVTWQLEITGRVAGVSLILANTKTPLAAEVLGAGRFRVRTTIAETNLYQLGVTSPDGNFMLWPELHAIKAIRDQPPRLTWQDPIATRTIVDPASGPPLVHVRIGTVDDHGVASVALVMTVAKGSGEGVKFREQEISLERVATDRAAGDTFGRTFDLSALGLEPGDELYFHAIASDRRTPTPNRTRSETRFIVLRGPQTELSAPPIGLAGINRLPQYFRSQRQLIIDTERLLSARPTLSDSAFREQSEEIGVDQKLLRLRYGQFLGEEFEPVSSGAPREAQGMALAGALRGQSREALNRASAVERAVEAQHLHPSPVDRGGRPLTVEELTAPFTHVHDTPEAATLFDAHVKTALRAVLAAMWDAEGFLRTGRPAEALPAENRALELLKALQQADRVYVKRVGHEPAPIKIDERRLRGDLDAIPKRAQTLSPPAARSADAVALASAFGAFGSAATTDVPPETATVVEAQLVAKAQERPEAFLSALELWRRRSSSLRPSERAVLRQALSSLLPPATETPERREESSPGLAREYFQALNANANRTP